MDSKTVTIGRELQLAMDIACCRGVGDALSNKLHPCSKIVHLQPGDISHESDRQRPEPWMGNLEESLVLFISSNPSINDDEKPFGENFPTFQWSDVDSAEFFVHRIGDASDPMHVTFDHETKRNFMTRAIDGEYRNGLKTPNKPQHTWSRIHERALELLGSVANPSQNYAITEIVHCKSRKEVGVKEASAFCIDQWMNPIMTVSPARILIIVGGQVRDRYAKPVLAVSPDFGSGDNYIGLSQKERSLRDIVLTDVGGSKRLTIFNYHPASWESKCPQKFEVIFGTKVVRWLQKVALGEVQIPLGKPELHAAIEALFEQ